ncbi:MAG: hypothetical protein RLZZ604_876 [Pseudomonadota bacterium]
MQSRATVLHVTSAAVGDCASILYIAIKGYAIANIAAENRRVPTVVSFALHGPVGQGASMSVYLHEEDLPAGVLADGPVAVDTETMGLITPRDRLCLLQISDGHGDEHLVRFGRNSDFSAPNLRAVLADPGRLKLFHFARFDLAAISHYLNVVATPLFCTKIASRLVRTYTDRHGLKELVKEMLSTDISKQQQSSDWGGPILSEAQKDYAASDVRYLHRLHAEFVVRLEREGRTDLAQACFDFLPHRANLDLSGWPETDIFGHS